MSEVKAIPKTIKQVLEEGTRFLASKGNTNARLEAEKLIAFGLEKQRVDIYLSLDKPLTEEELVPLRGYFTDRAAGKPLQYITGEVHFRYLRLRVNENTFIPRPETELIVELALKLVTPSSKVLELGAGSGAIALAIAQEGKIKVDAVEISKKALEVAEKNAQINNIGSVTWIKSDWFEKVNKKYDLILANPPYVSLKEFNNLPAEIKKHEPQQAVTDNGDGLQCLTEIIAAAPGYLNEKGSLLLEIGFDQKENVNKLFEEAGFKKINFEKDLTGKTRFCIASVNK